MNTITRKAEGNFQFSFRINKAQAVENEGKMTVVGIASTQNVDHDHERFAVEALKAMADSISKQSVPLRVEHSQSDNAIIGEVNKAWMDERDNLWISADLNADHPAAPILYKGLKDGIKMGLSVGGYIKSAVEEVAEGLGQAVKTFYDVMLDEVSVTQRPSNRDAWLMAKSFAKSEKEVGTLTDMFMGNVDMFERVYDGNILTAFAKSIPPEAWVKVDYKIKSNSNDMKKAEETTTEETTKASSTDTAEETTKAASEETTETVTKAQYDELVKMVSKGFNAMSKAFAKASEGAKDSANPDEAKEDPEAGKTVNKATGASAKDGEQPDDAKTDPEAGKNVNKTEADGSDTTGEREKASKKARKAAEDTTEETTKASKEDTDTYDLQTVERAIKAIEKAAEAYDTTEDTSKARKAADDTTEEAVTKSQGSTIDRFVKSVATYVEKTETAMKEQGYQTDHFAKSVVEAIRSNSGLQDDLRAMLREPGQKRSVTNGTPFIKMKDGRVMSLLSMEHPSARVEKSATEGQSFKSLWKRDLSSTENA
jgi:hypothetical protein